MSVSPNKPTTQTEEYAILRTEIDKIDRSSDVMFLAQRCIKNFPQKISENEFESLCGTLNQKIQSHESRLKINRESLPTTRNYLTKIQLVFRNYLDSLSIGKAKEALEELKIQPKKNTEKLGFLLNKLTSIKDKTDLISTFRKKNLQNQIDELANSLLDKKTLDSLALEIKSPEIELKGQKKDVQQESKTETPDNFWKGVLERELEKRQAAQKKEDQPPPLPPQDKSSEGTEKTTPIVSEIPATPSLSSIPLLEENEVLETKKEEIPFSMKVSPQEAPRKNILREKLVEAQRLCLSSDNLKTKTQILRSLTSASEGTLDLVISTLKKGIADPEIITGLLSSEGERELLLDALQEENPGPTLTKVLNASANSINLAKKAKGLGLQYKLFLDIPEINIPLASKALDKGILLPGCLKALMRAPLHNLSLVAKAIEYYNYDGQSSQVLETVAGLDFLEAKKIAERAKTAKNMTELEEALKDPLKEKKNEAIKKVSVLGVNRIQQSVVEAKNFLKTETKNLLNRVKK